eukprot:jgi/Mesvir1/17720/Mv01466-RA.1
MKESEEADPVAMVVVKLPEEMTNEELAKERARLLALNNGNENAEAVKRIQAYIEAREIEQSAFPTAADIAGADGDRQTGLEKASAQTLTFLERAYRETLRFSHDTPALRPSARGVNLIKDRLLECVEKTLNDEETRLRAVRDALTKDTSVRKAANDALNRYKEQWRPAYDTFEAYLEGDRARRAPNVMISFLMNMGIQGEIASYVENPYSFVRLNVAGNTPKVLEWLLSERYKQDNAGSKALRPILDGDSNAMKNNLKNASHKAMDEEAVRLRKSHDEHNAADISGKAAKKLLLDDFLRQKRAAEAAYGDAIDAEPRGVMFDFLWTTQEISKMSVDDISKLVANPAEWVQRSADNAKRMRTFIFTNEYFR